MCRKEAYAIEPFSSPMTALVWDDGLPYIHSSVGLR